MLLHSGKSSRAIIMSNSVEYEKLVELITELKNDNKMIKQELKASNDMISELIEEIRKKDVQISKLEDKVGVLSSQVDFLSKRAESNEQYSRRLSLRVSVPSVEEIKLTPDGCK